MNRLPKATVDNAEILLHSGKSIRETAKEIDISIGVVGKIRQKDSYNIPTHSTGRPYKASKPIHKDLIKAYNSNKIATIQQGKRLLKRTKKLDVDRHTVDRYLKMDGVKTYVQQKKRGLTNDQKCIRYEFAKNHMD